MNKKLSNIELVAELEAQDKLKARGYKWEICQTCQGRGQTHYVKESETRFRQDNFKIHTCYRCNGEGGVWVAPINKLS